MNNPASDAKPPVTGSSQFVEFWNAVLVPKFLRFEEILVEGFGKHSRIVFERGAVANPGERVLDVGCGFGDTAIDLARQTGPAGKAIGIDCCRAFLDICRAGAEQAGVGNIEWVEGDAETQEFDTPFNFWFSRFGTTFFSAPVAALHHLHRQLKPDGRMMMIVWRRRDLNQWAELPRQVVLRFLPEPETDACGPGPFSMGDRTVVSEQLSAAGYADIAFTPVEAPIMVGRSLDEAIDFQLALGPSGEIWREAGELAERKADEIRAALREALKPYLTDEGVVLPSSSWCITARNPA